MIELHHGDCLDVMPTLSSASVDAVICDPPYPEIPRDYGRMTEGEWLAMMKLLVPEVQRVLKPQGSAVFILQPNFRNPGAMRLWLWKFMVWVGEEWNIVQDAYWLNTTPYVTAHASQSGLLRSCIKPMVWAGPPDCYRNQDAILWTESESNRLKRMSDRATRMDLEYRPSGGQVREGRQVSAAGERGGVTPFNVLPTANANSQSSAGAHGHGAGTPYALADWWTRYICPPAGTVLDPFGGSGTMGLAAIANGCDFIGIEKMDKHYQTMKARVEAAADMPRTMRMELT
jgi:DNA modification methylase